MKKRIVCLLLIVAMLATVAVLFSSCGTKKVDLSKYTNVVYQSSLSAVGKAEAKAVATNLKKRSDTVVNAESARAGETVTKNSDYEILIGETDRPESAKALKKIKGHGYTITTFGKKIVIVGTTKLLTLMALQEFVNTTLAGEGTDGVVNKTTVKNLDMVELDTSWKFAYATGLDATISKENVSASNPNRVDYPIDVIYKLRDELAPIIGANAKKMTMYAGNLSGFEKEIIIGRHEGEQAVAFFQSMDVNEYGVSMQNKRLLVSAHNDTGLAAAKDMVIGFFEDSKVLDGDKTKILMPAEFSFVRGMENSNWCIDFPRPTGEGIRLSDSCDVFDNSLLFVYTGDGVNEDAYDAYCAELEAAGFTRYMQNSLTDGAGTFITYVNSESKATLHVSYMPYKYGAQQSVTEYKPSIRIVSAYTGYVNLPDAALVTRQLNFDKKIDSAVTAVKLNWMPAIDDPSEMQDPERGYGNSYIITLEDGSFIVMDTGFDNSVDDYNLYALLATQHIKATGSAPSKSNPIRIAAWFLTHDHGDHFQTMFNFIDNYVKSGEAKVERVLANFPSDAESFNAADSGVAARNKVLSYQQKYGMKYIKVHSGQRLYFANAILDVILTHEDVYPTRIARFNDTSTVIRVTLDHTDGNGNVSEGSRTTVMLLGDAEKKESRAMRAMYGPQLKSDMVQMAHHGGGGCDLDVYTLIGARIVMIPQSLEYYRVHCKTGSGGWGITYSVVHADNTEYVLISDTYHTTMTVSATGVDMSLRSPSNPNGIYSLNEDPNSNSQTRIEYSTATTGANAGAVIKR